MTVAALSAAEVPSPAPKRVVSRRRAIRRFKISLLAPLFALFALVLIPVLLLQLYFSLHQWTVYLGSWWDADFVGLDLFKDCLLYTSDAADEEDSVDLGGGRIT